MSKYVQGEYLSKCSPSQYGKLIDLVGSLTYLKELEYRDVVLSSEDLELLDNKVNKLIQEIHSWWENKLDNMDHVHRD